VCYIFLNMLLAAQMRDPIPLKSIFKIFLLDEFSSCTVYQLFDFPFKIIYHTPITSRNRQSDYHVKNNRMINYILLLLLGILLHLATDNQFCCWMILTNRLERSHMPRRLLSCQKFIIYRFFSILISN
jgi:hypothetical protein